jgi:hypothetical protein
MQGENSLPIQWRVPVRIRVGRGIPDAVRGPEEALHHHSYRWPATDGPHYDNARRQCLQALQKKLYVRPFLLPVSMQGCWNDEQSGPADHFDQLVFMTQTELKPVNELDSGLFGLRGIDLNPALVAPLAQRAM